MSCNNSQIIIGTELKLNIHIEPMGDITMSNYDFEVDVYCSAKANININKQDAIYIDDNNYVVLVDTNDLGVGNVKCKITAYIPDEDFKDGFRTEISGVITDIEIVRSL